MLSFVILAALNSYRTNCRNTLNSVFVYFLCRYKPLFCVHLITDVVKYGVYIVVGYFLCCVQETVWKGGCLWISWIYAVRYGNKRLEKQQLGVFCISFDSFNVNEVLSLLVCSVPNTGPITFCQLAISQVMHGNW